MSEPVELTEEIRSVMDDVSEFYHPDLPDALATHVKAREAAARREALLEAADAYSDWEVFVAADGINSIRAHGLEPDAWIRRFSETETPALAEPERDEEGGR